MADAAREPRRSPLGAMEKGLTGTDAARLAAREFRALVNLRGPAEDAGFLDAVAGVFGVAPPTKPNSWTGGNDRAALWLGPDEWLLIAPDGEAATIERSLRAARADDPWLSVVDVSNNYYGLTISGPEARTVLAKGCPLDLHERVFGPGACAQSVLAKTRILLRLLDDTPTFELWVRNSFARYAAEWLIDAANEFPER